MLGEQARRNEELEAKIHELKTKLVVSTLPRGGCSRQAVVRGCERGEVEVFSGTTK